MTTLYNVDVERTGMGQCRRIMVAASEPMLAAEHAERLAAMKLYGQEWASVVHQFFAYRVTELSGADMIEGAN